MTIDEFIDALLDCLMNNYHYPSEGFKDEIYGIVEDACVDAKKMSEEEQNK